MTPQSRSVPAIRQWTLPNLLGLLGLEALAVVIYYLVLPADPKNSLVFGLSATRLGLVLVFLVLVVACWLGSAKFSNQKENTERLLGRIHKSRYFAWMIAFSTLITLSALVAAFFPLKLIEEQYHTLWERLVPIFTWITLAAFELILWLVLSRYGFSLKGKIDRRITRTWGWISLGLALLWGVIALTGTGQTPDPISWRELGPPVLAWQFGLAILAGWGISYLRGKFQPNIGKWSRWIDAGLILCLYGLALWLWLGQPLQNSYFSPLARPPNQEVYPYSDALYYNLAAESVTVGEGLSMHSVTPRPMYLTILSYFVEFADGKYLGIITLLTFWLALIPVVMYLLGKRILNRGAGISLALIAIFREQVAIQATADIQLSNTKLIMADLPTLLVMLIFCYLAIGWLQNPSGGWKRPLGVGGCMGVMMLFRTQAVIVLPFLLALAFFRYRLKIQVWMVHSVIVVFACILVISPWLARNYQLTGKVIFDDPATQISLLQSRYQLEGTDSGEGGSIWTNLTQHPAGVIQFVANHFFRNEIGTVLVTPPQRLIGNWPLLFNQTSFWTAQKVSLNLSQQFGLASILALLALGIAESFSRAGWIGLIPLLINLAYTLGNGLARNSGGRYNLPVDWVGYFYLVMGLVQITSWILDGLGNKHQIVKPIEEILPVGAGVHWKSLLGWCTGLALIGASIPITESLFPETYQELNQNTASELLSGWGATDPDLLATVGSGKYEFAWEGNSTRAFIALGKGNRDLPGQRMQFQKIVGWVSN